MATSGLPSPHFCLVDWKIKPRIVGTKMAQRRAIKRNLESQGGLDGLIFRSTRQKCGNGSPLVAICFLSLVQDAFLFCCERCFLQGRIQGIVEAPMNLISRLTRKLCCDFWPCHSVAMAMHYDLIFFVGPGMSTSQEHFPATFTLVWIANSLEMIFGYRGPANARSSFLLNG